MPSDSYIHQSYPSWRYHATKKAQIVDDPEHEAQVAPPEDGWALEPVPKPAPDSADDADVQESEDAPVKTRRRR